MLVLVAVLSILAEPASPAGPSPQPPPRANEPRRALVVVRCTANYRTLRVRDCVVVSEDPPGRGFGEAALQAAPKMKLPPGFKPKAGEVEGVVELPMSFNLVK